MKCKLWYVISFVKAGYNTRMIKDVQFLLDLMRMPLLNPVKMPLKDALGPGISLMYVVMEMWNSVDLGDGVDLGDVSRKCESMLQCGSIL